MRILLRTVGHGFYQAPGKWTPDRAQAREFPHISDAVFEAVEQDLDGSEVYLAFPNPRYDLAVVAYRRRQAPVPALTKSNS